MVQILHFTEKICQVILKCKTWHKITELAIIKIKNPFETAGINVFENVGCGHY